MINSRGLTCESNSDTSTVILLANASQSNRCFTIYSDNNIYIVNCGIGRGAFDSFSTNFNEKKKGEKKNEKEEIFGMHYKQTSPLVIVDTKMYTTTTTPLLYWHSFDKIEETKSWARARATQADGKSVLIRLFSNALHSKFNQFANSILRSVTELYTVVVAGVVVVVLVDLFIAEWDFACVRQCVSR